MSKERARERKKKRAALAKRMAVSAPVSNAFEALPYEVQPGDYAVVAQDGTVMPLGPDIFGDDWPGARRMLAEIDPSTLPGIKEAQRQQAERRRLPRSSPDDPAAVIFKMNAEEDHLTARIDDLEVGFALDGGCYILVWGTETGCPCYYDNSNCPEDKNRDWRNCPVADNCPYEFTRAIEKDCTVMTPSEGTVAELEAKIKDMFASRHDGVAHDREWPEPAASIFAAAPWRLQ
jgi:hypothetical protein